jgi:hypothetical protein
LHRAKSIACVEFSERAREAGKTGNCGTVSILHDEIHVALARRARISLDRVMNAIRGDAMSDENWSKVEEVVEKLPLPEQKQVLSRLSDYIRKKERNKETPEERSTRQLQARMEVLEILKTVAPGPTDDPYVSEHPDKYIYGE